MVIDHVFRFHFKEEAGIQPARIPYSRATTVLPILGRILPALGICKRTYGGAGAVSVTHH
jgi:hypothetical protein